MYLPKEKIISEVTYFMLLVDFYLFIYIVGFVLIMLIVKTEKKILINIFVVKIGYM